MSRPIRLRLIAYAGAALLATFACAKQSAEEVDSDTPVAVTTAPASTGTVQAIVHATGLISPAPGAEQVIIAPEAARIVEMPRASGDRVARGDLLVRFEIPSTGAEVQRQAAEVTRAEAAVTAATAARTRAQALFDRGVAARREVEDSTRAVADAEAALAQARASLSAAQAVAARSVVRATFDGVVAKRLHNPGDLVEASASDPVLRVFDPRRLEVVASVPLNEVSRVTVNARGHLAGDTTSDDAPPLTVISRPAAVDPGTTTVPVRLAFARPPSLPAGTPVQVDIDAERHTDVVLVPASAIVRDGDDTAVFIVDGDKAKRTPVKLGIANGMVVEIVSGLTAGQPVIVDGQAGLPDGATITTKGASERGETKPAGDDK